MVRRLVMVLVLSVGLAGPALADGSFVPLDRWGDDGEIGPHVESVAATGDGSVAGARG